MTGVRPWATAAMSSQRLANFRRSSEGASSLPAPPVRTAEPILITGLRHREREERRLLIRFVSFECSKNRRVLHTCVQVKEELSGNTAGLKASHSKRLLATWRRRVQQRELVSAELARHLTELSREIGRQLGVLLNRRGEVEYVVVGDAHQLELPDIGRARAGQFRLRGLRLVHTHLKAEPLTRDDLTDLVLLRLDSVAAVVAREDGLPGPVYVGTLLPYNPSGELYRQEQYASVQDVAHDAA